MTTSDPRDVIDRVVACPRCHSPVEVLDDGATRCPAGHWDARLVDRTLLDDDTAGSSSFDHKHDMVDDHNHHPVVWELCYRRQLEVLESHLGAGDVLLDLGCGPTAPYRRPDGVTVVGIDASAESLAAHDGLDLGLHATSTSMAVADASVDVVAAVYVLHHMIGDSVAGSARNVEDTFRELARVTRPGGEIVVMEICPRRWSWKLEKTFWRLARRVLPSIVDFCFWPKDRLADVGSRILNGAELTVESFDVGRFAWFPPIIGIPWIKVPRFAYPFDVVLLRWTVGDTPAEPVDSVDGWWM